LRQATGTAFEEPTSRREQIYQKLTKQKDYMAVPWIQERQVLLRQASQEVGQQKTELKEV
jgi:hypothetical protein